MAVENGQTIYKWGTLGRSAVTESQFWSLENPLTTPNYASLYGMPPQNIIGNDSFIIAGTLKPGSCFVTRYAPGVGTNIEGGIEIVTPGLSVDLIYFVMP